MYWPCRDVVPQLLLKCVGKCRNLCPHWLLLCWKLAHDLETEHRGCASCARILEVAVERASASLTGHHAFHSRLMAPVLINHKVQVLSVSEPFLWLSTKPFLKVFLICLGGTSTVYVHWRQKLEELWPVWGSRSPWESPRRQQVLLAVLCQLCRAAWTHTPALSRRPVSRACCMTWTSDVRPSPCPLQWPGWGRLQGGPEHNRRKRTCLLAVIFPWPFFCFLFL